jgi:hypothetical protein
MVKGQIWPLQLIFVLLLVLAVLSISAPTAFSDKAPIGSSIAQILLWIAALAVAILLYLPVVREWLAVHSLIATQVNLIATQVNLIATQVSLIETQVSDPNKPTSVIGRLRTIETQTVAIGDVNTPGTVLERLTALETKLSDIGTRVEDGIETLSDEIAKLKIVP